MNNLIIKSTIDNTILEVDSNYGTTYEQALDNYDGDDVVYIGIADMGEEICMGITIEQTKELINELTKAVKVFDEDYRDNVISEIKVKIKAELEGVEEVEKTIEELQKKLNKLRVNYMV